MSSLQQHQLQLLPDIAHTYKVGDHVYFEEAPGAPYAIRKITELCKSQAGVVEAAVSCYYRRSDLPINLLNVLEKEYESDEENESESEEEVSSSKIEDDTFNHSKPKRLKFSDFSDYEQKHMHLCELFTSNMHETLPTRFIRGKCQVITYQEGIDQRWDFIDKTGTFFFTKKYDPEKKTLKSPNNVIRVGSKYQAEITEWKSAITPSEHDERTGELETCQFLPNKLTDVEINQFIYLVKSMGLMGRAMLHGRNSKTVFNQSLDLLTATSNCSRGATVQRAHDILHQCNYDLQEAIRSLFADSNITLQYDEMESWSVNEVNLFQDAMEKVGRQFRDVRLDYLPWKSMPELISFYYQWKTTDRYVKFAQRSLGVSSSSSFNLVNGSCNQSLFGGASKYRQIYIPPYTKINSSIAYNAAAVGVLLPCENCSTHHSKQWFSWSNNLANVCNSMTSASSLGNSLKRMKMCSDCWSYWKQHGALKPVETKETSKSNVNNQTPLAQNVNGNHRPILTIQYNNTSPTQTMSTFSTQLSPIVNPLAIVCGANPSLNGGTSWLHVNWRIRLARRITSCYCRRLARNIKKSLQYPERTSDWLLGKGREYEKSLKSYALAQGHDPNLLIAHILAQSFLLPSSKALHLTHPHIDNVIPKLKLMISPNSSDLIGNQQNPSYVVNGHKRCATSPPNFQNNGNNKRFCPSPESTIANGTEHS